MEWRGPSSVEVEERAPVRRWLRLAIAAGVPLALAISLVWIERRPIATHYIDRTFATQGVPARYRIADLGPGRQRLTDVVIGDPAHPDLVADWIETETGLGLHGVALSGMRAGRVRVRARLIDGRLSLGTIDRLLPAGGGGRTGLPTWDVAIGDARLRLETPAGVVGIGVRGRGRLNGGFVGRAALVGPALASGGCALAGARATVRVTTRAGVVGLAGPVAAARLDCGATRLQAPRVALDLGVDPVAATVRGRVQVAGGALTDPRLRAASVAGGGTIDAGSGKATGRLSLIASGVVAAGGAARGLSIAGDYSLGDDSRFDGRVGVVGASVDARTLVALRRAAVGAEGTPVGPLANGAATALAKAAGSFAGSAMVAVARRGGKIGATISEVALGSPTGAMASFRGSAVLTGAIDGRLALGGGGLPTIAATVRRGAGGAPVTGVVKAQPYAVGSAALALTPAAFSLASNGALRLSTVATLSGPLGDGRVDDLALPLTVRRDATGGLWIDEACAPLSVGRLATGGLRLERARLALCPVDGALVRVAANGAVGGGAKTGPIRLGGRLGGSPLTIEAGGASVTLATRRFTATGVRASLGTPGRQTRFAAATLTGGPAAGGVAGEFAGGGGRIGAVPLLMSDAGGRWWFAGGALTIDGTLSIADADAAEASCPPRANGPPPPRFCPMLARDVVLRLADNRIAATGTLTEPTSGSRVAGIAIAHDLASGIGHADLSVTKLAFAKGLQPDQLTPVTQGVIANVAGTIDGAGRIAWSDDGVTSSGRFITAGTDLAAAFGPVTGIAGSIEFTDLLGLVSAPGQQLTVASINPGVVVENGVIRFHTEPGVKVAVESARWPFAGGTLTLDPTLLDFSAPAERRMTFRVDGIAADRFLQQFDFKNLAATGTFDGVLPMIFDASGGRIEQGHLTVRESGGGIAYVGDLSEKDLGTWGNLAFQALKSLRYRSLSIIMNGPLEGEMVTEVRFAGISQGTGAKSNFLIRRLQRLPFVFNVRIKAPFRELLQTTGSFADPSDLIRRNLPALMGPPPVQPPPTQAPAVQPGASAPVPETKRP